MPEPQSYRWPTKLKKFGITDPFQRLVVAKYEGEIPWQAVVKDAETLNRFIAEHMLPRLLERVDYPPRQGVKSHYVSARHVDLDLALATDPELDATDKGVIELIRAEDGEAAAVGALLELVNGRKAEAFREWLEVAETTYREQPAFRLLLLRPLFDLSGPGTRRPVVPADASVIDWLRRRIFDGRILPSQNLGRVYCWRLGSGGQRVAANGWQYIPRGPANADRLAAAARGSGWCVASTSFGNGYLEHSAFFILRQDGKPVVALRVENERVVECQGRYNDAPKGWEQDIRLFTETMGLKIDHRKQLIMDAAAAGPALDDGPLAWWRERVRFWPFAASKAPREVRERLQHEGAVDVSDYVDFPGLHRLLDGLGIRLGLGDWCQIVEIDPVRYGNCPHDLQYEEGLREACIRGWLARVEDDDVTMHELISVEDFVKRDARYQDVLQAHFPKDLYKRLRRPPRTMGERTARFRMEDLLPASVGEGRSIAVNRAVSILLSNEDGDFRDERFPEALRAREDFPAVRRAAWLEAMLAHPPLWFALPADLADEAAFQPVSPASLRVDLERWLTRIERKPWLLTQQTGVPKSIRRHPRVLATYRHRWAQYVSQTPWKLWQSRGLYLRVYMSYGLLADPITLSAMEEGWRRRLDRIDACWANASRRMRFLFPVQVTALRAIQSSRLHRVSERAYLVMLDIRDRLQVHDRLHAGGTLVREITNRLAEERLYLQDPN